MPHLFAFRIISAPWMSHAILSKKKLVPPLDGMSDNDDKRDIYTDYSYWRIASSLVYYASRCSPLLTSSFAIINLQHLLTRLVIFSSLGCAKKRPFVKSFSLIERCHKWLGKLLNHRLFLSLSRERDISQIITRFIFRVAFDHLKFRARFPFFTKNYSNHFWRNDRSIDRVINTCPDVWRDRSRGLQMRI